MKTKTMAHYLIIMFMVMLLIFRFIVLFTTSLAIDFPVKSYNQAMEVGVIFINLVCIILFTKTKLIGGILYVATAFIYYGFEFIKIFPSIINSTISLELAIQAIILIIELVIPIFAFFILLYDKKQEIAPTDKKTDFFYKGNQYDRKYDDRADKNNYRTM